MWNFLFGNKVVKTTNVVTLTTSIEEMKLKNINNYSENDMLDFGLFLGDNYKQFKNLEIGEIFKKWKEL